MRSANEPRRRSPLKRKPLRNPGESVHAEMQRLTEDQLLPLLFVVVVIYLLTGYEWWRWAVDTPPHPFVMTLVAAATTVYALRRFLRLRKRYRSLAQGRDGEKKVGQFLENLRAEGYRVFHDIQCEGFNIDHVVVGPRGVFVVETKTFNKPVHGNAVVNFDGETMRVNGYEPDRNPVAQARAARDWVRNFLFETTTHEYPVRGVVVMPGWWVESPKDHRTEIWVLNPNALPAYIANERVEMKEEDVALAASRLVNHIVHM